MVDVDAMDGDLRGLTAAELVDATAEVRARLTYHLGGSLLQAERRDQGRVEELLGLLVALRAEDERRGGAVVMDDVP